MTLRAAIAAGLVAWAVIASAEPVEPPPEAPSGADYEAEPADSLEDDAVELSLGASGRPGETMRRTRRVRVDSDSLGATLREGAGDPLAGGSFETRGRGRGFGVGRLAPRWGRGLLLGSAAEPWSFDTADRGRGSRFRGRAGEGAWASHGERIKTQAMYGRFARRSLGVASLEGHGLGIASLLDGSGGVQASLMRETNGRAAELAFDGRGRWRAEGMLSRRLAQVTLSGRVRGGHAAFRSLAEPKRSGPAQALAVAFAARNARLSLDALGAMWRYRSGFTGSRVSAEVGIPLDQGGALTLGVEQLEGARREPTGAAVRPGLRQGWWCAWQGGTASLSLGIRHETWGQRAIVRRPVRVVSLARVDALLPLGLRFGVASTVFRVERGESAYLPEAQGDRLVLRALSGTGQSTRVELSLPVAGGAMRASADLADAGPRRSRSRWSLDWTRRLKLKRKR